MIQKHGMTEYHGGATRKAVLVLSKSKIAQKVGFTVIVASACCGGGIYCRVRHDGCDGHGDCYGIVEVCHA